MKVAVIIVALLAAVGSCHGAAYIANVAYLHSPLPSGTTFNPEVSVLAANIAPMPPQIAPNGSQSAHRGLAVLIIDNPQLVPYTPFVQANQTALLTFAELDQNATTKVTTFDWELVFSEPLSFAACLPGVAHYLQLILRRS